MSGQNSGIPVIETRNLRKVYGGLRPLMALEDISLTIYEGELVAMLGPSGCGKSTFLRLLAGLIPRTKGEIYVFSQPLEESKQNIGIVFQDPTLLPWRTVLGNILLPIEIAKQDKADFHSKALDIMKIAGLEGFERNYPHELSGGMQQRVALCRALIFDPRILLMDEPFGALDAFTREKLNLEFLRIWGAESLSRKTVLLVTHSISEAIFLSDRVVILSPRPGQIIDIVDVHLPRPRTAKVKREKDFVELQSLISSRMGLE